MSTKKRFGVMLDVSRNGVMKPEEIKRFAKFLRDFGYNMIQLYTEDTYEVMGEPYFGYMRGRYSIAEMKDMVDYCEGIGLEVIPCIQTLAHLNQIFRWPKYAAINDTADILLAGDERTYALIENMFKTLKECFHSDYVHIGMDEAHLLGLGQYLDKNGYQNRFDILSSHLRRVTEIAKKYGFKCLLWSDMFFRLANHGEYYTLDDVITDEIAAKCPKDVGLVYWDYYHPTQDYYDSMLEQHKKLVEDVWFCGHVSRGRGFSPFNAWSIESMSVGIKSAKGQGVDNVMVSMWGDGGSECSVYATLPALFAIAKAYEGMTDKEEIKRLFHEATGEDFDAMMALDLPNHVAGWDPHNNDYLGSRANNSSKVMLYNDPFLGVYDSIVKEGVADEYRGHANTLYALAKKSASFAYVFEAEAALCEFLSHKYDLGARTRAAYQGGDKDALSALVVEYEKASELLEVFYKKHRARWHAENKPHGFDVQEIRLGAVMLRLRSCRERLLAYLAGEIEGIGELEEILLDVYGKGEVHTKRLPMSYSWSENITVNVLNIN